MTISLTQLLAVSALLSAAEKAVTAKAPSTRDDEMMCNAIEYVRAAFAPLEGNKMEAKQKHAG